MKRDYIYLISSLPELIINFEAQKIDFETFRREIEEHVHPNDYELVKTLFYPYDNQNLLNILLNKNLLFLKKGNFTQETLDEKIKNRNLPKYMNYFIEVFEDDKRDKKDDDPEEKPKFPDEILKLYERDKENLLQTLFYNEILKIKNTFLRNWFTFDRELRNVQTAIVARRLQIDASNYFVGENAQVYAQNTSADFGLSDEIDWVNKILQIAEIPDALEREREIDLFRWEKIEEMSVYNYFGIDVLLAFIKKADIADRWLSLDKQTGKQMFDSILKDLMKTCDTKKIFNKKDEK